MNRYEYKITIETDEDIYGRMEDHIRDAVEEEFSETKIYLSIEKVVETVLPKIHECPICKGKMRIIAQDKGHLKGKFDLECERCELNTTTGWNSREIAIKGWNSKF